MVRKGNARGLIVRSDCIDLLSHVDRESVDLAYLDPPFSVGVPFGARTKKKETRARGSKTSGPVAYDDRWPSLDAYITWLSARIDVIRGSLSARGTMWLHLDHRAVHEAKIASDEIFGRAAFVGEIIWLPGNGSKARRGPGTTHQTILIYARGDGFIWNSKDESLRAPYAKTSLAMHFTQKDDHGRLFRERTIANKTYRYYADVGRAIGSVWSDCPAMSANTPLRKETTGYPTQKPLKLLDRIVRAASALDSLVMDPFCGSGTTLEAASRLGRRFVGCDVGNLAIETSVARLKAVGADFDFEDETELQIERARRMETVMTSAALYPLFLKLKDRTVIVVGAGPVAERKITDFVAANAKVVVVAPDATDKVRALAASGAIEWRERSFEDTDADGAWLVIAATNDIDVQTRATAAAEKRRAFSVAVDDLPRGSAYSAAVVRRAPFVIAISSTGEAPALTRLLREVLEQMLPAEEWVEVARELRAKWKREGLPMGSRFAELLRAFKEKAREP